MTPRVEVGKLRIAKSLYSFVNQEALPDLGLDQQQFWSAFELMIEELAPRNRQL